MLKATASCRASQAPVTMEFAQAYHHTVHLGSSDGPGETRAMSVSCRMPSLVAASADSSKSSCAPRHTTLVPESMSLQVTSILTSISCHSVGLKSPTGAKVILCPSVSKTLLEPLRSPLYNAHKCPLITLTQPSLALDFAETFLRCLGQNGAALHLPPLAYPRGFRV